MEWRDQVAGAMRCAAPPLVRCDWDGGQGREAWATGTYGVHTHSHTADGQSGEVVGGGWWSVDNGSEVGYLERRLISQERHVIKAWCSGTKMYLIRGEKVPRLPNPKIAGVGLERVQELPA